MEYLSAGGEHRFHLGYYQSMRKTFATLAATCTILTLAACGSDSPDATDTTEESLASVEFSTPQELYDRIDAEDSPVSCVEREEVAPPEIESAEHQVNCIEATSSLTTIATYASDDDLEEHLSIVRGTAEWEYQDMAVLRGANWTVDCKSVAQCKDWQKGFGGELLSAKGA